MVKRMKTTVVYAEPIQWPRADPVALEAFDEDSRPCTMNCGPHRDDPRSSKERKFLCDDCLTRRE